MANWDLSSTATSTTTPATAGDWTDETDHLIGTSLTNMDPTINTYWTTTVGRVDDVYVSRDWGTAFSQSAHTLTGGGAELAPPSGRGSRGQLYPR
jgi:hypothetical protein